jgi:VCBS repeat-containing protein
MENDTTAFVPQDYSVVLENSTLGIFVNLRNPSSPGSDNLITGLDGGPKYATLYVDNAVNENISPSGNSAVPGNNVTFTVTVANTGRYPDNYTLGVTHTKGWSYTISPSSLSINAGGSATATLTVTLDDPGIDNITVTASGVYASDSASCTAIGIVRGVNVLIQPEENSA